MVSLWTAGWHANFSDWLHGDIQAYIVYSVRMLKIETKPANTVVCVQYSSFSSASTKEII